MFIEIINQIEILEYRASRPPVPFLVSAFVPAQRFIAPQKCVAAAHVLRWSSVRTISAPKSIAAGRGRNDRNRSASVV
jgi:hypothetical protein